MPTNHPAWNLVAILFGVLLRMVIGMSVMLLGGLMTITFWLMPLGLPLILLGVAILISAALVKDPAPNKGRESRHHADV